METKKKVTNALGKLCSALSHANIMIYKFENKKWWSRKNKTANSKKIDNWDRLSRIWCEKRNKIKNKIDSLITDLLKENYYQKGLVKKHRPFQFQVLPISLMIDMLTIENIKIYDLGLKKNIKAAAKATAKRAALIKEIDNSIKTVISSGSYDVKTEVRTF